MLDYFMIGLYILFDMFIKIKALIMRYYHIYQAHKNYI